MLAIHHHLGRFDLDQDQRSLRGSERIITDGRRTSAKIDAQRISQWGGSMKSRDLNRRDRRRDMLIGEQRQDPYKSRAKLAEPSVCARCGALFSHGRWSWSEVVPDGAENVTCPACQRIGDNYPAGEIVLNGSYPAAHRDEIVRLIRNIEEQEKSEHPLERIIAIQNVESALVVTTTGLHLPRRIGHALEHAHKGELATHYDEDGYFVRIGWSRAVNH